MLIHVITMSFTFIYAEKLLKIFIDSFSVYLNKLSEHKPVNKYEAVHLGGQLLCFVLVNR